MKTILIQTTMNMIQKTSSNKIIQNLKKLLLKKILILIHNKILIQIFKVILINIPVKITIILINYSNNSYKQVNFIAISIKINKI